MPTTNERSDSLPPTSLSPPPPPPPPSTLPFAARGADVAAATLNPSNALVSKLTSAPTSCALTDCLNAASWCTSPNNAPVARATPSPAARDALLIATSNFTPAALFNRRCLPPPPALRTLLIDTASGVQAAPPTPSCVANALAYAACAACVKERGVKPPNPV